MPRTKLPLDNDNKSNYLALHLLIEGYSWVGLSRILGISVSFTKDLLINRPWDLTMQQALIVAGLLGKDISFVFELVTGYPLYTRLEKSERRKRSLRRLKLTEADAERILSRYRSTGKTSGDGRAGSSFLDDL